MSDSKGKRMSDCNFCVEITEYENGKPYNGYRCHLKGGSHAAMWWGKCDGDECVFMRILKVKP